MDLLNNALDTIKYRKEQANKSASEALQKESKSESAADGVPANTAENLSIAKMINVASVLTKLSLGKGSDTAVAKAENLFLIDLATVYLQTEGGQALLKEHGLTFPEDLSVFYGSELGVDFKKPAPLQTNASKVSVINAKLEKLKAFYDVAVTKDAFKCDDSSLDGVAFDTFYNNLSHMKLPVTDKSLLSTYLVEQFFTFVLNMDKLSHLNVSSSSDLHKMRIKFLEKCGTTLMSANEINKKISKLTFEVLESAEDVDLAKILPSKDAISALKGYLESKDVSAFDNLKFKMMLMAYYEGVKEIAGSEEAKFFTVVNELCVQSGPVDAVKSVLGDEGFNTKTLDVSGKIELIAIFAKYATTAMKGFEPVVKNDAAEEKTPEGAEVADENVVPSDSNTQAEVDKSGAEKNDATDNANAQGKEGAENAQLDLDGTKTSLNPNEDAKLPSGANANATGQPGASNKGKGSISLTNNTVFNKQLNGNVSLVDGKGNPRK